MIRTDLADASAPPPRRAGVERGSRFAGGRPGTGRSAWRRAVLVAGLVLSVAPARPVVAADFCATVRTLVDHAPSGFADIAETPNGESGAGGIALALPGSESCAVTSQPNGKAYHCVRKYPYRAEAALAAFSEIDRELRRCLGDGASARDDARVNHPDSYDSRHYALDRATVSVSLKDKAALDGTFLFVRVSP